MKVWGLERERESAREKERDIERQRESERERQRSVSTNTAAMHAHPPRLCLSRGAERGLWFGVRGSGLRIEG